MSNNTGIRPGTTVTMRDRHAGGQLVRVTVERVYFDEALGKHRVFGTVAGRDHVSTYFHSDELVEHAPTPSGLPTSGEQDALL